MQYVRFETHDGVGTLTLDNSATRNALNRDMSAEIREVVRGIKAGDEVRALVITGAGGHFCAGGDLRSVGGPPRDGQAWRDGLQRSHEGLQDLLTLNRPVIAAVDGVAFGAGLGLALLADFVLATPRARFCAAFIRIGLVPDYGLFYTLPRFVGKQRAKELAMSGREVGGEEALRLGLAMELHAPEHLLERAQAIAASLAQASPMALGMIKRIMASADDLGTRLELEADAQALAAGTQAHRDAVQDFLEKRPARFRWPD